MSTTLEISGLQCQTRTGDTSSNVHIYSLFADVGPIYPSQSNLFYCLERWGLEDHVYHPELEER